jgi:peptide/nickel transport system permease protein
MLAVMKNKPTDETPWYKRLLLGGAEQMVKRHPVYEFRIEGTELIAEEFNGRNDEIEGRELRFSLADIVWPLDPKAAVEIENGMVRAVLYDGTPVSETLDNLRSITLEKAVHKETYWLGTDKFGRDLLSRIMGGTIVSLGVGIISVLISLLIGISLGAAAGYFRGAVDETIMWLINVMWSVPTLLLVMAITLALGKGFTQVFIAVGLTMWVEVARVVRGQVLSIREQEYVEAGRALGFRPARIIARHILPNVMAPVIVLSAANFASAILIEAGLSFLGIGAQIPMPSWGQMIKEHYSYITTDLAYLAVLPGLCIMLLVLAFMLVGNGLRDAMDHRALQ